MFNEFQQTAQAIFDSARQRGGLVRNPDSARLKALALEEPDVRQTKYGSVCADSEPMSRAAKFTKNNIDSLFGAPSKSSSNRPAVPWPTRISYPST